MDREIGQKIYAPDLSIQGLKKFLMVTGAILTHGVYHWDYSITFTVSVLVTVIIHWIQMHTIIIRHLLDQPCLPFYAWKKLKSYLTAAYHFQPFTKQHKFK